MRECRRVRGSKFEGEAPVASSSALEIWVRRMTAMRKADPLLSPFLREIRSTTNSAQLMNRMRIFDSNLPSFGSLLHLWAMDQNTNPTETPVIVLYESWKDPQSKCRVWPIDKTWKKLHKREDYKEVFTQWALLVRPNFETQSRLNSQGICSFTNYEPT